VVQIGINTVESLTYTIIRNDLSIYDSLVGTFGDPINSLRRYSPGDTVRILGRAQDDASELDPIVVPAMSLRSDLLALSADFRPRRRAGSDSVSSSARRQQERRGQRLAVGAGTTFNNTPLGNGSKDCRPCVDENGNGQYDCGGHSPIHQYRVHLKIRDIGDFTWTRKIRRSGWYYVEYWIDFNDATWWPIPTAATTSPPR
jgi:hypothetical protein